MPGYEYSPLPTGSSSIRVLLLLPSTDDTASINCQLINYSLPTTGDGYLPYEALSYVWGSESTPRCIFLDGTTLSITDNLYAALLHLRDHQLPRMLWVDAVCINQQDEQEKGYQIQLMPTIYGRASHVIVWLGRAADHSDRALDDIRLAAEGSTAQWGKEADSSAILMLLQRPWFRRIWILQEISAARSILVMCGHTKINGITFVLGLTALNLSYEGDADSGLENVIRSITYLMRGAFSRPDYVTQPHGMLSLGELIDMYHTREATKKHDKVYALLGMSSESANKADLLPNYQLSWDILFKRVITSILPEVHSVETWPDREIAVFQGRGLILGRIDSVESDSSRYDRQCVEISFNNSPTSRRYRPSWGTRWTLQATARSIQEGDIVCLLHGALTPSIVTMCGDYFTLKMISAVAHVERQGREMINIKLQKPLQGGGSFLRDILLVWDWEVSQANSGKEDQPQVPKKLKDTVPNSEINLNRNRPHDMALIIEDIMIIAIEAGAHGHRITEVLFEINGLALPISERVVKMVAGNSAWGSEIMWQLVKLFHKRDDNPPISKDVVEVAAGNIGCGDNIIRWLAQALDRKGLILPISEDTVKNVAGNTALGGDIIGYLVHLLDQKGHSLPISEDVVRIAAGNTGCGGYIIEQLTELFDRRGQILPISEDMVNIIAGNTTWGDNILGHLIYLSDQKGHKLPISEDVVRITAGNTGCGSGIMWKLMRHTHLPIREDTLKVAAKNVGCGARIIAQILPLFDQRSISGDTLRDTLNIAAGNSGCGDKIIAQILPIFDRKNDHLSPILEDTLRIAACNTGCGDNIRKQLKKFLLRRLPFIEVMGGAGLVK